MSVCRVCLSGNLKLYSLKNIHLKDIYEKLSNSQFDTDDARPRVLCCFCYRELLRCSSFSETAHRSEKNLSLVFQKGLEASYKNITKLNLGKKTNLSVTPLQLMTVNENANTVNENENCEVSIKIEPVKEEIIEEGDLEVYVNSFTLEEVKREIIIEEDDFKQSSIEIDDDLTDIEDTLTRNSDNSCKKESVGNKFISHKREKRDKKLKLKGKQLSNKHDLAKHKTVQSEAKKYICDICAKAFSLKCNLLKHMPVHTGEKRFVCNVCCKRFSRSDHLVKHLRIHTSENSYPCKLCVKRFSSRSNLVTHMRIHRGEKLFPCDICDKQFSTKFNMIVHFKSHSERPFICDICDKEYNFKNHYILHLKTHREK